jgi:hypothetical protein
MILDLALLMLAITAFDTLWTFSDGPPAFGGRLGPHRMVAPPVHKRVRS